MDWNNDGKLDILSGCYWTEDADAGHIQLLLGNGDLDFAEAVALKNVAGNPLENIDLNGDEEKQTLTICTQQHAVDYDGDGDLDLVVGCFGANFYLYENKAESANAEPALAETPVELPIRSTSQHAAPHLVDWDKDGDLDLLSGTSNGGVIFSENTGTHSAPKWSDFKQLVPPSGLREQSTAGGRPVKMSPSTRVWATDWNGDGWLDLLVGDSASIVDPKEGLDPEEYERLRSEHQKKMAAISKKQQALMPEYQAAMEAGEEPSEELEAKMSAISEEYMEAHESQEEFQTTTRTGFVWLLVRKR